MRTITRDAGSALENKYDAAATNTAVQVGQNGQANVYGLRFENTNATIVYLQLYDLASGSAPTPGTTVPTRTYMIPASVVVQIDPNEVLHHFVNGLYYSVGTSRTNGTAPGSVCGLQVWFSQS